VEWNEFLPHVLPSCEGCPESLALDHIKKAARTFCARTLLWQYSLPTIHSAAGIGEYTLNLGPGEDIVRVLLIEVNGAAYGMPSGAMGRQLRRQGRGNYATMTGLYDFVLSPAPSFNDMAIVCDVAVKPRMDSIEWPDDFEENLTDIVHGAIATLCMLDKRQSWFDLDKSTTQGALFADRCSTVAMKVERGYGTSRRHANITWM
jgi:hypothetical protein